MTGAVLAAPWQQSASPPSSGNGVLRWLGGSVDRPLTGHPLELVASLSLEGKHGPGHEIAHGCRRYHVVGLAERADPGRGMDGESGQALRHPRAFAGVDPGSHRHAGRPRDGLNCERGTNGARGGIGDRHDAVTGRVHELAAGMLDPCTAVRVVLAQKLTPPPISQARDGLRKVDPNTRRTARHPWRAANTKPSIDTQLGVPLGSPPPEHYPYLVQRDATPKVG